MRRVTLLAALFASVTGCVDASRVNRRCGWVDASTSHLDLSRAADREHLRRDVQLAGELGVREADVNFRNQAEPEERVQRACTNALLDTIARRHGLPRARVVEASYWRVWWADLLAVYLPLAAVVALAMSAIVGRIQRSFDPADRPMAIACATSFVAVVPMIGLGLGQFWAFNVETAFLRNEHLAFRGTFVPILRHGWIAYFLLLALCAGVAFWRMHRTPLGRVERTYASYLGARARA